MTVKTFNISCKKIFVWGDFGVYFSGYLALLLIGYEGIDMVLYKWGTSGNVKCP